MNHLYKLSNAVDFTIMFKMSILYFYTIILLYLRILTNKYLSYFAQRWKHNFLLSLCDSATEWPDWAKFCCLNTFYLNIFLHFQVNKMFENIIWFTYFNIKSSWVWMFWTFNLSFGHSFGYISKYWVNFCSIFWSLCSATISAMLSRSLINESW